MSAIERSLRSALDKGDAADPVFRRALYASARQALDRLVESHQPGPEAERAHRARLEAAIAEIEADYGGRETDPLPASPSPERRFAPTPTMSDRPSRATAEPLALDAAPDRARRPAPAAHRPRWPIVAGAALGILALAVAAVVLVSPLSAIVQALGGGNGSNDPASAAWIAVFSGSELEAVSTSDGASAELVASGAGGALKVTPAAGGQGTVSIEIGQGVLNRIAGRHVEAELTVGASAQGAGAAELTCRFADASLCGRPTLRTADEEEVFMVEFDVPSQDQAPASFDFTFEAADTPDGLVLHGIRMRIVDDRAETAAPVVRSAYLS
ncbi:hypothetical protein [Consotaella aegiceratis]|uniref:hypothetical protein n=1 Tax=Consotaella aegiceratis TaxID=3097961 RepID=UPI002F3F8C73